MVDESDQTSMTTTCSTASMNTENDENGHTHAFVSSLSSDSDASVRYFHVIIIFN